MRVLAVDTSSERGSLAVAEGATLMGERRLAANGHHAESLFRSVESLFSSLSFTLGDIDLFVAARGPGSFTGLRVGLAAMQGFSSAFQRPGAGICTLEALAWKSGVQNELLAPTLDARRGEVYGALYRREGERLVEERAPCVLPPADWFGSLPNARIHLFGDGAERHQSLTENPQWTFHGMDLYLAPAMAAMAAASPETIGPLEPLYVRKTDAEILRGAR